MSKLGALVGGALTYYVVRRSFVKPLESGFTSGPTGAQEAMSIGAGVAAYVALGGRLGG